MVSATLPPRVVLLGEEGESPGESNWGEPWAEALPGHGPGGRVQT